MIGNRLKVFRTQKGYTLTELSKKSGVSYVQISRYEKNKSQPTAKVLKRLATALEVDFTLFFVNDKKSIVDEEKLQHQFIELMNLIREEEETKLALSKIFEAFIFKERKKRRIKY